MYGRWFRIKYRDDGDCLVTELFPGVDGIYSTYLQVPSTSKVDGPGTPHMWHLLDNEDELLARGIEPIGTLVCVHGNPTWSYLWP